MILTLGYAVVFVRYPQMPIEPDTLAGTIYYVCNSAALLGINQQAGSTLELSKEAQGSLRCYRFGKMVSTSGDECVGISYADTGEL
jgi:hypothetical protein